MVIRFLMGRQKYAAPCTLMLIRRDDNPGILDPGKWNLPTTPMNEGESAYDAADRALDDKFGPGYAGQVVMVGSVTTPSGKSELVFIDWLDTPWPQLTGGCGNAIGTFTIDAVISENSRGNLAGIVTTYFMEHIDALRRFVEVGIPDRF
jgi:hypothetical protein